VRFILAPAEALPQVLNGVVDEAWVIYPWGTLLRGVMHPDPAVLCGIAGVLRPGGALIVVVNESALAGRDRAGILAQTQGCGVVHDAALRAGYNEAGLRVTSVRSGEMQLRSSWGGRLGQGRPLRTVWIEAVRDGDGRDHGRR
jgi:16S rRNA (adenine(1408)-N(1))-methyltransferase